MANSPRQGRRCFFPQPREEPPLSWTKRHWRAQGANRTAVSIGPGEFVSALCLHDELGVDRRTTHFDKQSGQAGGGHYILENIRTTHETSCLKAGQRAGTLAANSNESFMISAAWL